MGWLERGEFMVMVRICPDVPVRRSMSPSANSISTPRACPSASAAKRGCMRSTAWGCSSASAASQVCPAASVRALPPAHFTLCSSPGAVARTTYTPLASGGSTTDAEREEACMRVCQASRPSIVYTAICTLEGWGRASCTRPSAMRRSPAVPERRLPMAVRSPLALSRSVSCPRREALRPLERFSTSTSSTVLLSPRPANVILYTGCPASARTATEGNASAAAAIRQSERRMRVIAFFIGVEFG